MADKLRQCPACKAMFDGDKKVCPDCRAIPSPFSDSPEMWIRLPERWVGEHATRVYEASRKVDPDVGPLMANLARSMVLLDDWNIPGLNGNPENWDFSKLDLQTIAWIVLLTYEAGYMQNFNIPVDF